MRRHYASEDEEAKCRHLKECMQTDHDHIVSERGRAASNARMEKWQQDAMAAAAVHLFQDVSEGSRARP